MKEETHNLVDFIKDHGIDWKDFDSAREKLEELYDDRASHYSRLSLINGILGLGNPICIANGS
jgi:hypothetical protein